MRDQATSDLLKTIKKLLREKGLSYSDLAKVLSLSLSSVKRLMSGNEISFSRLFTICDLMGMEVKDVLEVHAEHDDGLFRFTEEQELHFANSPQYLAYLYELAGGLDPGQIEKKWRITRRSTKKYLERLQGLGLIRSSNTNKIILKAKGHFAWNDNGTLGRAFSRIQIQAFSEHVVNSLGLPNSIVLEFSSLNLSDKNYGDLRTDLNLLSRKYLQISRFNRKALPKDQVHRYTFIGMADRWYKAPYRTVTEL